MREPATTAVRRKTHLLDREVKNIHSLAHLLGQFEDFDRGPAPVDRVALGIVHRTIEQSALTIWNALDEFMLAQTARRRLEESG